MDTGQIMAVVNQIAISKEEHQLIEWKQPVSGDASNLAVALSGNTINKSTVEELKQVLRLVFVKVGLRANNFPNDEEKDVLIGHVINYYGNHTPLEIRLAFEMAITYKLDLPEKDIPCYENFSCAYVSKIMNAYRRWAVEERKQIIKTEPVMIAEPKEVSPIEMIEWINEWKSKDKIILDLIPLVFYEFMVTTDMIEAPKEMRIDYFNRSATIIKTELMNELPVCKTNDAYKAMQEFTKQEDLKFKESTSLKIRIANKAKKLIVYDYFKK